MALVTKRYTWRHDSILANLEEPLRQHISKANQAKHTPKQKSISECFVKEGKRSKPQPKLRYSYLDNANDWQLLIDFDHCPIVFPPAIFATSERPDIIIWSNSTRKVLIVELTCPAEQGIEAAEIRKKTRYANLIENISARWKADLMTIEVGARGLVALSTASFLKKIGFDNRTAKIIIKAISNTALRCSFAIYLASKSEQWNHRDLLVCLPDSLKAESPPAIQQNQLPQEPEIKEEKIPSITAAQKERMVANRNKAIALRTRKTATTQEGSQNLKSDESQKSTCLTATTLITAEQRERMIENKKQALARIAKKASPVEVTTLTTDQKEKITAKREQALAKLAQKEAARSSYTHPYMTRQKNTK